MGVEEVDWELLNGIDPSQLDDETVDQVYIYCPPVFLYSKKKFSLKINI